MLHFTNPLLKTSILALGLASGLTACSSKGDGPESDARKLDVAAIQQSASLSPEQKSERMAKASERLMTPASFMYAADVVNEAIEQDPKNARARFWKAALGPAMEMKGVLSRIEPLVKQRPDAWARYAQTVADIKQRNPERAVTEFLFDGRTDIATERDAQELIARVTLKLDEFRKVVKQLKEENAEFSIYINDEAAKTRSISEAVGHCAWRETSPMVYELGECDLSKAYEVTLNRADFEGIQHVIAGYQTYLTLLNAYDVSGIYTKSTQLGNDPEAGLDLLMKDKSFGTLRETHGLGAIPEAGRDAIMGVKYAMTMQKELCPKGTETPANRPGHLFRDGFCFATTQESDRVLWIAEQMLSGQTVALSNVQVNAMKAFEAPTTDLRKLLPAGFDRCGRVVHVSEPTLNGVFPSGDFNEILADRSNQSCY